MSNFLTEHDENELESLDSESSNNSAFSSNDVHDLNINDSSRSSDSSINSDQLRHESLLILGEDACSSDESSIESNEIEDCTFLNDNHGDSLENKGEEKQWTDQKHLFHDPKRSIASHFVLNNYFRTLNRKTPMHENAKSSFTMQ